MKTPLKLNIDKMVQIATAIHLARSALPTFTLGRKNLLI